jgi:hypothetical protein
MGFEGCSVIPAKTGTHVLSECDADQKALGRRWIPAFAGMTTC